jgi:isopenicillin-N epimerase
MTKSFKDDFLLDPAVHFLNHGSFGACPRPVFEEYQRWQRELEKQPIELLSQRVITLMRSARETLAGYLNCPAEDLIYFPNPTTAINMVARSLGLTTGDEILASNHEYGAMNRTWRFMTVKTGARYINHPVPLPVSTQDEVVERFWEGVTPHTKVIFLSQITSQTALIFPVAEICARARIAGILTIIDGAHAPGQIPVDLEAIGADLYTGACHKWLCAPKGAAFLYASKQVQPWLEPLVVSWGYQAEEPGESQFIDHHEWQGTRDMSAFLSVPAAIRYQEQHDWTGIRQGCRELLAAWRDKLIEITGCPAICPDSPEWWVQMAAFQLPEVDTKGLKSRLYDEYRVEVPIYRWEGLPFLRVSVQAYNTADDLLALAEGLKALLPQLRAV